MINSGIVRKIDDLGRIVLPKEIRKTLNINTGDDFQILVDNNRIVLDKYLVLENYETRIINIINHFIKETKYSIFITVNDKIINYNNEDISKIISNIIRTRKKYISDRYDKNIVSDKLVLEGKLIILPIVIDSDLLGSLIIIGNDSIKNLDICSNIIYDLIKDVIKKNY